MCDLQKVTTLFILLILALYYRNNNGTNFMWFSKTLHDYTQNVVHSTRHTAKSAQQILHINSMLILYMPHKNDILKLLLKKILIIPLSLKGNTNEKAHDFFSVFGQMCTYHNCNHSVISVYTLVV